MPKVRPFGSPIPYKHEQWVWATISVKVKESVARKWFGGADKKRLKIFDGENHHSTEWERVDKGPRKPAPSDAKNNEKQKLERRVARAAASAAKAENIEAAKVDVSGMTQEQLEALAAGVRVRAHGGPIEGPNAKKTKAGLVPLPEDWSR